LNKKLIVLFSDGGKSGKDLGDVPVTLVFFIGGCTFAEISALRFLSQMENGKYVQESIACLQRLISGFFPSHMSSFNGVSCGHYQNIEREFISQVTRSSTIPAVEPLVISYYLFHDRAYYWKHIESRHVYFASISEKRFIYSPIANRNIRPFSDAAFVSV
jgi:hypothetical protein